MHTRAVIFVVCFLALSATEPLFAEDSAPDVPMIPQTQVTAGPVHRGLLVSFAALQAVDAVSTLVAVHQGAREANPLMAGLTGTPVAFASVKAASTAASVWGLDRLARTHPKAALLTLGVLNGLYTFVAINNLHRIGSR